MGLFTVVARRGWEMSGRPSAARDWRPWAFVAAAVVLGVADVLSPHEVVLVTFLVVPIVGSAVLGRPGVTVVVTVLSLALAGEGAVQNSYPVGDTVRRFLVLAMSGALAFVLARIVQTSQAGLADERGRYQLLAENTSDVVYLAGADGRVTWISPNVSATLGWTPEELLGNRMYDHVHPDDQERLRAARESLFRGSPADRRPHAYLARVRTTDDAWVWMSVRTTPIADESGTLTAVVSGMRDVTELVEARQAAEADEELLAVNVEAVMDPLVLLKAVRDDRDRVVDFTFAWVNQAACDQLGLPSQDLVGSPFLATVSRDAAPGLLAVCIAAIDSASPTVIDAYRFARHDPDVARFYDVRARRVADDRLSLTWRDVTERHTAAERISASEERYRLLAENSSDVVLLERAGIMAWLSPALMSTLGWSPGAWEGHRIEEFTHPDDIALTQRRREEISAGATRVTTLRMRDSRGGYHWVEVHAGPFTGSDGREDGIVASFRVTDREVAAQEELERRARFDDLTGVLKRDEALQRLGRISGDMRRSGHESAVLFCDLDRFKDVNDTHGHAAGDEVLRATARRIRACVRAGDTVARMGGDEFLVVLDGVHELDEAADIAEKIRASISGPIEVPGGVVTTTMSIGVTLSGAGENADAMVARADEAMYDAKAAGRDKVITIAAA
jgi:diguanylate cyclase (GGDEF)-like protein/PAS domain S-box-containing protein